MTAATSTDTINTRNVQIQLNALGFGPLVTDGLKGPKTDAAVVAFKKSVGLRARPYIGPLTYKALMADAPESDVPWLAAAIAVKGLHEGRNTSKLKRWFDKSVSWIDPRDVPWCGAFVATAMRKYDSKIGLPDNPLGARNWQHFGVECKPQLGAVMVFWRGSRAGWKGHVALYWGEDRHNYFVLGGNQANAVTVTRIAKSRFLAARWVSGVAQPETVVHLSSKGVPLSVNEA